MIQTFQGSAQEQKMLALEVQQKYVMMMGGDVNKKQVKLSPEAIKKLREDYMRMYIGFVSINWGQGKTLGTSWQKAIEQMDAYVASKNKIVGHPVNDELFKFHAERRYLMAKTIMTSPYADNKLDKRLQEKFLKFGMEDLRNGKSALDATYKQYMPEKAVEKSQNAQSFKSARMHVQQMVQQAVMKRMLLLERQRQHEISE